MSTLDAVLAEGYDLEVDDRFASPHRSRWSPSHLRHWSSLHLMLAAFGFRDLTVADPGPYQKEFAVQWFRSYRPRS
jgi:hypothetical protein